MNRKWVKKFKTVVCLGITTVMLGLWGAPSAKAQSFTQADVDSLLNLINNSENQFEKVTWYNRVSNIYRRFDPEKGIQYGYIGLDIAIEIGDELLIGRLYGTLGSNYGSIANYEKSLEYYQKSLDYYRAIGNKQGMVIVLTNIGLTSQMTGDYAGSLEVLFEALKISEELGIKNPNLLNNISNVYIFAEQYDFAIKYKEDALEVCIELDNRECEANIFAGLGDLYNEMKEPQLAEENWTKALSLYRDVGNLNSVAFLLYKISIIQIDTFRYIDALKNLEEALLISETRNDNRTVAAIKGNIARIYFGSYQNRNNDELADQLIPGSTTFLLTNVIDYNLDALEIFKQIGEFGQIRNTNGLLATAYEELGQYQQALIYFKEYTAANDSLKNIERAERIEQLTTQREIELRDKQIELDRLAVLKKRNERVYFIIGMFLLGFGLMFVYRNYSNQRKANVVLDGLNKEIEVKNENLTLTLKELRETQEQLIETERLKQRSMTRERISQDIHDDISSGLTKISWLAELMKTRAAKNPEVDLTIVEKINGFARDSVTKLGEIIWSTNPESDNLASLLSYMRNYITKYMEDSNVRYYVDFPDVESELPINPELRRNVYLVMKEALHNAMKYSGAKNIEVSFLLDDDNFEMTITDNGKGMEPGVIEGGGNGMANMRKRMEKIGGTFDVISASGEGTKVVCKAKVF